MEKYIILTRYKKIPNTTKKIAECTDYYTAILVKEALKQYYKDLNSISINLQKKK